MDLKIGFEEAIANEQLIHGVLKRLHIYRTSNNYQDYVQGYEEFKSRDTSLEKFNVYIFQKLLWRMTDMLRQEQKFFDVHSLEVFDFERVKQEETELIAELNIDCLTDFEKQLFYDSFIRGVTLPKLAKIYGCSDRNLRYHRDSIKSKLRKRLT